MKRRLILFENKYFSRLLQNIYITMFVINIYIRAKLTFRNINTLWIFIDGI